MPRKGRLVQPRHIFPWLAAPWIEFLRVLWRIERFILTPIRYLQAWTLSAIFGVIGVILSVALFIPRFTESVVEASSSGASSSLISSEDLPYLPPTSQDSFPSGTVAIQAELQRTWIRNFDQLEMVTIGSQSSVNKSRSLLAYRDGWRDHTLFESSLPERARRIEPYTHVARIWHEAVAPAPPEYFSNNGDRDSQPAFRTAGLTVTKEVPATAPPGEPFTYFLDVHNAGQTTIESAIVRETVTDFHSGLSDASATENARSFADRIIDVDPPAEVSHDYTELVWNLHQLQPDEKRRLRVTMQPNEAVDLTMQSTVEIVSAPVYGEFIVHSKPTPPPLERALPEPPVEPAITIEPEVRPSIRGVPQLVLQFEPRENEVTVGDELNAFYTITNVGTADADDVLLMVSVPPQLRHRFGELVQHRIKVLKPNEEKRALFAAIIEERGQIPLEWSLSAENVEGQQSVEWLVAGANSALPDREIAGPSRRSIPSEEAVPGIRLRPEPDPMPTAVPVPIGGPRDRVAPTIPPEGLPTPPPEPLRPLREPTTGPASPLGTPFDSGELSDQWRGREAPIDPELTPEEAPSGSSIPGRSSIPHGDENSERSSIPVEEPANSEPPLGLDLENSIPEPDSTPSIPRDFPAEAPEPAEETKIQ